MKAAVVLVAGLGFAAPSLAQEALTADEFLRQAIEDNVADVEFGRMVRADPSLPSGVHQVGQALARTSAEMTGTLVRLAGAAGVPPTTEPAEQDRQMIQRLSRLQGDEFTREYLLYVINDLERDIKFYQGAAEMDSPDIRRFAQDAVPVLQTNLATAEKVLEEQTAAAEERDAGQEEAR